MNTSTKIFIAIIAVVILLATAELVLSHFLQKEFERRHAPAQNTSQPATQQPR